MTRWPARYILTLPSQHAERQASSGLIVSTGTGATGWCRSAWLERHSIRTLPARTEPRLTWFVRESMAIPGHRHHITEGDLTAGRSLTVTAESDQLVLFGDGIETDAIPLRWGQTARLRLATQTLRLLRLPMRLGQFTGSQYLMNACSGVLHCRRLHISHHGATGRLSAG